MTLHALVHFMLSGGDLSSMRGRDDFQECINTVKLITGHFLEELIDAARPAVDTDLEKFLMVDGPVLGGSRRMMNAVPSSGMKS